MSSTPGIQALEFQGLVRHEPNPWYYIESISMQKIKEIYELREEVELSLLSWSKLTTDAFSSIQRLIRPINDWQRIQQDDFFRIPNWISNILFVRSKFKLFIVRSNINFAFFHRNNKYGLLGLIEDFLRGTAWEESFYKIASVAAEDNRLTSEPICLCR